MSRQTGTIEIQLRLPCSHVVGSGCISTWLQENNSCPVCRREFFPAQPRAYLEYDIAGDQEDEEHEVEGPGNRNQQLRSRLASVNRLCEEYCDRLPLANGHRISVFSQRLAEDYASRATWAQHSTENIAAACVYLACSFVGRVTSDHDLVAAAAVNLAQTTIDSSHMSIIDEIFEGSDRIQNTIEAFLGCLPQMR